MGAPRERILTPPGVRPEPPDIAWSPDATQLAFYGRDAEGFWLYTVDVASGAAHRVTSAGPLFGAIQTLQWSPDGEYIYYNRGAYCRGGCLPGFLYRIRPDGTGEEKITDLRVSIVFGFVP
jgi:Tol biopolymer transport system component